MSRRWASLEEIITVVVSGLTEYGVDMVDGTRPSSWRVMIIELDDHGRPVNAIVVWLVLPCAGPGEVNLAETRLENASHLDVRDLVLEVMHVFLEKSDEEAMLCRVELAHWKTGWRLQLVAAGRAGDDVAWRDVVDDRLVALRVVE